MSDNVDRFGHCILCHRNLIVTRVIDGKVTRCFHPEHTESTFVLSDNSFMRVCICQPCKQGIEQNHNTYNRIMEAVKNGWQEEMDSDPDRWPKERRKRFNDHHQKLNILVSADGKSRTSLMRKVRQQKR